MFEYSAIYISLELLTLGGSFTATHHTMAATTVGILNIRNVPSNVLVIGNTTGKVIAKVTAFPAVITDMKIPIAIKLPSPMVTKSLMVELTPNHTLSLT